jgi:hypothetical protein
MWMAGLPFVFSKDRRRRSAPRTEPLRSGTQHGSGRTHPHRPSRLTYACSCNLRLRAAWRCLCAALVHLPRCFLRSRKPPLRYDLHHRHVPKSVRLGLHGYGLHSL